MRWWGTSQVRIWQIFSQIMTQLGGGESIGNNRYCRPGILYCILCPLDHYRPTKYKMILNLLE